MGAAEPQKDSPSLDFGCKYRG